MEVSTVIDPAIEAFFDERKEAWLKKNTSTAMNEQQLREKQQECEQNFLLSNWLPDAAKRICSRALTTHPSKFTHPSTGVGKKNKSNGTFVSPILFQGMHRNDGFFRTGNIQCDVVDSVGNSAELDVEDFLRIIISDGMSVIQHIENETNFCRKLLNVEEGEYVKLRENLLAIKNSNDPISTNSKIKQVYFPITDGEYHLLSLLTHSGHLFELRQRLDALRFGEEVKQARECRKNGLLHPDGYQEIFGLTTIGFGGTKPQNISVLNNKNAGKAHLLASIPPELKPRNLRLPTTDFFKESFTAWQARETIEALHRLFKTDYNNINIRDGRDYRIQEYVDLVIHRMWQVRLFLADYKGELSRDLKPEQKLWLYPEYDQYRLEENEWIEGIIRQISRSLVLNYSKVTNNSTALADDELLAIERVVRDNKEALR
ncbi:type I-F CRISPR-associated protein Csy1 [Vibrio parahaemolyticus]